MGRAVRETGTATGPLWCQHRLPGPTAKARWGRQGPVPAFWEAVTYTNGPGHRYFQTNSSTDENAGHLSSARTHITRSERQTRYGKGAGCCDSSYTHVLAKVGVVKFFPLKIPLRVKPMSALACQSPRAPNSIAVASCQMQALPVQQV